MLESLSTKVYGNQQPSLEREFFEGSTTRTYQLDQLMKFIQSKWIENALLSK
nr:MAG TPA: hypothetical protein [Caudoviricetes sp.]